MKTCVMECYTHRWNKIDHLFKYHQMRQIGLKKGLINKSLVLIFFQIGCSVQCSTSFSNRVSLQRLTTHHLLEPQNSKFSNMSGRWLIAHMTPQAQRQSFFRWISSLFKSANFKPLQIHSQNSI